eukprot:GHRQ01034422.1.p1 GENE.GHRQ01034422.1~~GHRQ01034422.1.p1  ORF type:complete len:252 (-),score=71.12 GHRQ01034422.1:65-718(-)
MPLAEPFEGRLTPFQKLLVLRCLRPDRVLAGVQDFVAAQLGSQFIEPPPFDLAACFKESSATTPLVFVLSPGNNCCLGKVTLTHSGRKLDVCMPCSSHCSSSSMGPTSVTTLTSACCLFIRCCSSPCAGADPMADLLKLAEEMKFSRKFEKVSLGQGQGPKAEKLLEAGMERGLWVCLQNCHLAISWMPALERIVENVQPDKVRLRGVCQWLLRLLW